MSRRTERIRIDKRTTIKTTKILILGQSLSRNYPHSLPWQRGNSSKRLWKWFDVKNYRELRKIAICKNIDQFVNEYKVYNFILKKNIDKIFLIGKKAQIVFPYSVNKDIVKSKIEKFTFCMIPHPSGLNVSCNYKDGAIQKTIKEVLR